MDEPDWSCAPLLRERWPLRRQPRQRKSATADYQLSKTTQMKAYKGGACFETTDQEIAMPFRALEESGGSRRWRQGEARTDDRMATRRSETVGSCHTTPQCLPSTRYCWRLRPRSQKLNPELPERISPSFMLQSPSMDPPDEYTQRQG